MQKHYDSIKIKPLMENEDGCLLRGIVPRVNLPIMLPLILLSTQRGGNPTLIVSRNIVQNVINPCIGCIIEDTQNMGNKNGLPVVITVIAVGTYGWIHKNNTIKCLYINVIYPSSSPKLLNRRICLGQGIIR